MRKTALAIITLTLASVFPVRAAAQVSISASHITDSFERPISAARLCFTPVNANSSTAGFRVGSIQVVPNEVCGAVSAGILQSGLSLAPTPTGYGYHVYLKPPAANTILQDYGVTAITGSSWTLDSYDTPVGAGGNSLSVGTTTTLAAGASASCTLTGAAPNFALNCAVPQGVKGDAGTTTANGSNGDFSVPGVLTATSVDGVIHATSEAGATADVKIAACLAALASGGTCDARGFGATTQTIANTVTVGDGTHTQTLLLDPATVFVPGASSTQLFAVKEGGSIENLTCNVTSVTGWNAACVGTSGEISGPGYSMTHIEHVRCIGAGNTVGTCVSVPGLGTAYVDWLTVLDTQVTGMLNGISLSTASGATAWVNGNVFKYTVCVGTVNCVYGNAQGGEISQNLFVNPQLQWQVAGETLINFAAAASSKANANEFQNVAAYDVASGQSIVSLSTNTFNNQISGFLCLGPSPGCGVKVTDSGSNNRIYDAVMGANINSFYDVRDSAGNRVGYIQADGVNGNFVFGLPSTSAQFRFENGNGGLNFEAGSGTDHNLYLNSMDANSAAQIVFQKPIAPATSGSANNLACYKLSSGYLALGYCSTAPSGTPPTCTCQ